MTVKTVIASWGNTATSSTNGQYGFPGGTISLSATENFRNAEWSEAGTAEDLHTWITTNGSSASFSVTLRKNAANTAVTLSVSAGATGEFQDLVNTVSLAVGDNIAIAHGAHTTSSYTIRGSYFCFTPDTSGVAIQRYGGVSGSSYTTASTTRLTHNQAINSWQTVEAHTQTEMKHAATAEYFHTRVSANSRTTTQTLGMRINGADSSMLVSVTSTATGQFNDLVNTPSLAVDDLWALFHRTGTGTQGVTVQFVGCAIRSTGGYSTTSSWGTLTTYTTASSTTYRGLIGHTGSSNSLADMAYELLVDAVLSNYSVRCPTNARTTASTQTIVDDADVATAISISCTASTTGRFRDTTNTDTVGPGDRRASRLTTGTGTGGIATNTHDLRWEAASAPPSTDLRRPVLPGNTAVMRAATI